MSATALLGSVAVTALQSAGAVQELLRSAKSDSLVEYTRVSRVEPLVFVDEGLVHLDYMPNVMQSLSALFAGAGNGGANLFGSGAADVFARGQRAFDGQN